MIPVLLCLEFSKTLKEGKSMQVTEYLIALGIDINKPISESILKSNNVHPTFTDDMITTAAMDKNVQNNRIENNR